MLRRRSPTAGSLLLSTLSLNASRRATKVGRCTGKPCSTAAAATPAAPAAKHTQPRESANNYTSFPPKYNHDAHRLKAPNPNSHTGGRSHVPRWLFRTCCLQTSFVHSISGRHTYTSGLNRLGMTEWKPEGGRNSREPTAASSSRTSREATNCEKQPCPQPRTPRASKPQAASQAIKPHC